MRIRLLLVAFMLGTSMIKPVLACTESIVVSSEERIGFAKRVQPFAKVHHDLVRLTLIFPAEDKGEKIESVTLLLRNKVSSKQLFVDLPIQEDGSIVLTIGTDFIHKVAFQFTYSWCNHIYEYRVPTDLVYE